jgi:hypothetical protein
VDNPGSAQAKGVYIKAGFDAGGDSWWNSKESLSGDIDVNGSIEYTMGLIPPSNKHTRLIVEIMYDGQVVDISYSKWFDS